MREYRGDRPRGSHDDTGSGVGARGLAKERTPEEVATTYVYRLRQEVESAAARAKGLAAIAQRDEWRIERDHVKQTYAELREQFKQHADDARVSERAQQHHAAAARELDELEAALASAREPRAIPPVHGEETIEPRIVHRSIPADDVLAWMAELPSGQRQALVERVRRVQGSADRSDGFGVALANYLAAARLTSQFFGVAENPRRFNRAAYDKARARGNAASAAAASAASDASPRAAAPGAGEDPVLAAAVLETSDSAASARPVPPDSASGQAPSELPHRAEMERSFGRPLRHVQAYTGMDRELAPHGAHAIAIGNVVAFADARPSPATVAHEVTHAVQNEQAGAAAPMASGVVAPRDSPAEAEADAVAGMVAAHGPGVRLPPITAAPAAHVHLAPKRLVPDPDLKPHPTILVPDANHPARSDLDGEQVIQTGATTAPGKPTLLRGKSWKSLAEVAESIDVQDDSGDSLHIDLTYRLESRPAEAGDVSDVWIHTERKALLTIGTGEHAGATIVGQALIRLAPGEPRDPRAAIGKPSIGPGHWAQIYLAEAGQYVNLHGPGGRASLRADAADSDMFAYDDPLRVLVGLKNLLKQQHVAGHGGAVAKAHAQAQRLLANAKLGRAILEREIASIKSHHDPHPGRVTPVRFLVGDIALWLAANQQAGRDGTEDARQLHKAQAELEQLIADTENAQPPRRNQFDDALHAPVRFAERTAGGLGEVGAMAVDAVVLGVDAIGEATGIGRFDYHPISKYGQSIAASGSDTTTALVTMVNGFADEWSDAIERARHGDYRGVTDASIDTLLLIDGARTGGVIALDKIDAVAAKVSNVAKSARAALQSTYASARGVPTEVRNIAAAMADGADAFVARLRAGGMQMAAAGDGSGPGQQFGGLSGETLAEAAQAAKDAFKDKRTAQHAPKHGERVSPHGDPARALPDPEAKPSASVTDSPAERPPTAVAEPSDPATWMARLEQGLSADEIVKLDKMKHGKTLAEQRAMFDGDLETSREKVRAAVRVEQEAAASKAQSKARIEKLKKTIADKGLMSDPELRAIVGDVSKKPKDKLPTLRDRLVAKLLKVEVQAEHPNAEVLDGVKLYERLPEVTFEEWKTKHPGQRIDGLTRRDDGLYMQRGELDMMVIERDPAGTKGKIVLREEIKTGVGDTSADAKSQLKNQSDLFKEGASGAKKLRIEVGGRDIASDIDLASDADATKFTRGPAGKGFDKSLGVTASDLEGLCKDLLRSSPATGGIP